MLSLLRQPRPRRFFLAHAQSQLGTGAAYVALLLVVYQRTHSSWAVSLVLLSDFLPSVLLGPYFGVLADRHSRRTLAISAELVRAGAFVGLALTVSFPTTVGFALLAGAGGALFRPAINAALPTLVSDAQRSHATALYGGLLSLGFTLGPALCGLLLMFAPPTWVLLLDGGTFLISALLLTGVPLGGAVQTDGREQASAWRETREGTGYAIRERPVAIVLLIGAASVLCGALINVAEPLLAINTLHAGSSGFSILITVFGGGLVAGSAYTSRLGSRLPVLRGHFLGGVAITAVAMLGCAAAGSLASALAPFALFGFANAMILTPEIRLVQELVQERFRGRVFGLRDSLESACFALAFVAAGALLSAVGPRSIYLLAAALLTGAAGAGLLALRLPQNGEAGASERRLAERLGAELA